MKKALIVWGGWDGHQPKEVGEFSLALLREENLKSRYPIRWTSFADAELMASASIYRTGMDDGEIEQEQLRLCWIPFKQAAASQAVMAAWAIRSATKWSISIWSAANGWRIRAMTAFVTMST